MKVLFTASCILFFGLSLNAQSWTSSTQITGTDDINVIKSVSDINDNTIVLGEYFGEIDLGSGSTLPSNGMRDYFLLKFNSDGALDWAKNIGGPQNDFVYGGVGIDQSGNIYVSGGFMNKAFFTPSDSIEGMMMDIFLAKYTETGSVEWYKNVGTGGKAQRPSSLTVSASGNIFLAGTFMDSIKFNETTTLYSENAVSDYFYSEFDNEGNLNWAKQIKASNNPLSGTVFDIQANASYLTMTGVYSDTIMIEDKVLASDSLFDVHLIRTNLTGDLQWVRSIGGEGYVYSYNIAFDDDENVYVSGYYNCPSLIIDSTETEKITIEGNAGSYDFFVVKYNSAGTFQWARTNGGVGIDKLYDIEYFNQEITVCGYFTDSIAWGGKSLVAEGETGDLDMFTGALDLEGNYSSTNRFGGRNNSHEEAYSISTTADKKYNVIRSNSDVLQLGDETYFSFNEKYYLVFGVVGCLPISIDRVESVDVSGCFGDSAGIIEISAAGGFGGPWEYSIENGENPQTDITRFDSLPAGDYQVVVWDIKGCAKKYDEITTVGQPDLLEIDFISSSDITNDAEGSIVVGAIGGTASFHFTLLPEGLEQNDGTFLFAPGDSGLYVVELSDDPGCGPVRTDTIEIKDLSTSAVSEETLMTLRVYPNPTSNLVNIEMQLDAAEVNIEVVSLMGQIVMRKEAFTSGGELRETLDVSDLAKGMYMLRVNGQTLKSSIVVQ